MADLSREEIESIADAIEKWGGDDFIDINGVTDRASQFAMIALRQLLTATEWKPIETAPGLDGNNRILVWSSKHPPDNQVQIRLADGEFWRREKVGPSHWMALPLPPSPHTEGE
jgi:hypothetical protein